MRLNVQISQIQNDSCFGISRWNWKYWKAVSKFDLVKDVVQNPLETSQKKKTVLEKQLNYRAKKNSYINYVRSLEEENYNSGILSIQDRYNLKNY